MEETNSLVTSHMDNVHVSRFFDEIPKPNRSYFLKPQEEKLITVIVPFYNESWDPLQKTIVSLEKCQQKLISQTDDKMLQKYTFAYCFIQDGWKFADESVKDKLKVIFPRENVWNEIETWTEKNYMEEIPQNEIKDGKREIRLDSLRVTETDQNTSTTRKDKVTYIFHTTSADGSLRKTKIPGTEISIYMSLIIKKDNRKKHNSHQWFFSPNGYCGALNPKFCFATDCSTLFAEDCLYLLLKKMKEEKKAVVCTGRQVVMDATMQENKDSLIERIYRNAQRYDFESSFLLVGAFQLFGFLPVVPGPCGLYRWKQINSSDGPLDWYFKIVNTPTIECGLILSNLKIAEDRILSYGSVLKAKEETKMIVEAHAEFYFEAETDLSQFVKQRRRWINGTLAGYLYLLSNYDLIFNSKMNTRRKCGVFLLTLLQTIICLMTQLTPSIFLCAFYSILIVLFGVTPNEPFAYAAINGIFLGFIALYIYFVIRHAQEGEENTFVGWIFYVLLFFSMNVVIITIGASIGHMIFGPWTEENRILSTNWLLVISYSVLILPQLFNLQYPRSFVRSLQSFVPFCLFLPMLISWFSSYSAARFWDVSWGNRPSQAIVQTTIISIETKYKIVKQKIYSQALAYVLLLILANLSVVLVYIFNFQSSTFIIAMVIFIAGFQVTFLLISGIFFIFNLGLYWLFVIPIRKGITKILEKLPKYQYEIIGHDYAPSKRHMFQLGFFQLVIQLSYQFMFQSLTQDLYIYDPKKFDNYNIQSAGFPLLGLLFCFVALGDRKFANWAVYKMVMIAGVILFELGTIIIVALLLISNISVTTKYWLLLSQAYIQVTALNLIGASTYCLFLLYAKQTELLKYILVKSILGAFGNFIPSAILFAVSYLNHTTALLTKSIILCLAHLIAVFIYWKATEGQPPQNVISLGKDGVSRHRKVAILLVTLFMFTFGISPIQFELKSYFDDRHVKNSNIYSFVAFLIQEVIVIIVGLLTAFTPLKKRIKEVSVVLGMTSLLQFIFLTPLGDNWIVGLTLVSLFGFYRTFIDVFAFYFFAKDIQDDNFHVGFWVALFNTTIIVAEGLGYNVMSVILYKSGVPNMKWLFGGAAIANFFGLAMVWRVSGRNLHN